MIPYIWNGSTCMLCCAFNMGNCACGMGMGIDTETKTIQLVLSDGTVRILTKPVTAGQIMQESPQHLVCHSESFYIGQKTAALSENDELRADNKYFLLPELFFQTELTLVSIASVLSPSSPPTPAGRVSAAPLRTIERASAQCQPFEIQPSDGGGSRRIKVSPQFVIKIMEEGRINVNKRGHAAESDSTDNIHRLCDTPDLLKEYEKLVTSRNQCWQPKLDAIQEQEKKFDGCKTMFGIKRLRLNNH